MTRALPALLALAPLALALNGCALLGGGDPPPNLLTLSAASQVQPGETQVAAAGNAITVSAPVLVPELNTVRVPVRVGDTAVAYVKDAQWVETPDEIFRGLLSEVIAARTGRVVLSADQRDVDPGTRLGGQLLAFSVLADRNEVLVSYQARLVRPGGATIEVRRFEGRAPIAAVTRAQVAQAFNTAANAVAAEVAEFVGRGTS